MYNVHHMKRERRWVVADEWSMIVIVNNYNSYIQLLLNKTIKHTFNNNW